MKKKYFVHIGVLITVLILGGSFLPIFAKSKEKSLIKKSKSGALVLGWNILGQYDPQTKKIISPTVKKKDVQPLVNPAALAHQKGPSFTATPTNVPKGKAKKPVPTPHLKSFINKKVNIKGFVIPLDFNSKELKEFLLVPYIPSCAHVPPPQENQIIFVKLPKGKKVKFAYTPVELEGVLSISKKEGQGSFTIVSSKVGSLIPQD